MSTNSAVEILLIGPDIDDAGHIIRTLQKLHLANHKVHLQDGEEALNYPLNGNNKMPRLILLDLKMPKADGIDVLQKIKAREETKIIPVVVLLSSCEEECDIIRSCPSGINAFNVKPVDCNKLVKVFGDAGLFWLMLNQPLTAFSVNDYENCIKNG